MAKHPRLKRRGAVYQFRAKVPVDLLAEYAPRREVTFSLRTKDPAEALRKVRVEGVRFDQEVARKRRLQAAQPQTTLSGGDIERLVAVYMHERLKEDDESRLEQTGAEGGFYEAVRDELTASGVTFKAAFSPSQTSSDGRMSDREYGRAGEAIAIVRAAAKEALARGDVSFVEEGIEMVCDTSGIKVSPGSEAHRRLSEAMLKAEVRLYDLLAQRHQGDVVDTPNAPATQTQVSEADDAGVTFSGLWTLYKVEKKLIPKTASDFGTQANRFIQVAGDLPVRQIKKTHIRVFKDAMLRMGVALFERHSRGVRLSPAGVALELRAHALAAELSHAAETIRQLRTTARGLVRVGAGPARSPGSSGGYCMCIGSPLAMAR